MMLLRILLDLYRIQVEKRNFWKAFYKLGEESLNNLDHLRNRESSLNEASRRSNLKSESPKHNTLIGRLLPFRSRWPGGYGSLKAKERSLFVFARGQFSCGGVRSARASLDHDVSSRVTPNCLKASLILLTNS